MNTTALAEAIAQIPFELLDSMRQLRPGQFLAPTLSEGRSLRERFILGTFEGRQVAVATTPKFGSPSVAMATDILASAGAKVMLGIGYCGAIRPDIACGDLVIVTGAVRDEGTTPHYVPLGFPALASPVVVSELVRVAADMNLGYHIGIMWTTDAVLCEDDAQISDWHEAGVIGVDMEAATLLTVASLRGAQAGVILVASDNPLLKRQADLKRLRAGYCQALQVALKALSAINAKGRDLSIGH